MIENYQKFDYKAMDLIKTLSFLLNFKQESCKKVMKFLLILLAVSAVYGSIVEYKIRHKVLTIIDDDNAFSTEEDDRNSRLINANNATDGQFPFSARLSLSRTDGRVTRCSGSIISTNFVLSAGNY